MIFHIAICSPDGALRSRLEHQCMEFFARREDACIVEQLQSSEVLLQQDATGLRYELYLIELAAVARPEGLTAAAELRRREGGHILPGGQVEVHDMVGAFQIFNFCISQRPHAVGGGHGKGGAVFRLHRPLEQGRDLRLVHRLQQILHGVHPVGAVCVGRGACHKGQRSAAAPDPSC